MVLTKINNNEAPQLTRVTLFDLDKTLLPIDSDHAWGEFLVQQNLVDAQYFKLQNDKFYQDYCAGVLDIHEYISFAVEPIIKYGEEISLKLRERYIAQIITPVIKSNVLALIQKHKARGDILAIVTATNEFITTPIAKILEIDTLIAIALEKGLTSFNNDTIENAWFTGKIQGTPSFREGKVLRVKEWLETKKLNFLNTWITFYSDSMNDLPLLEHVHEPIATNADDRLRTLAKARNWQILDLF